MKVKCLTQYFDKSLQKYIKKDETFVIEDEKRIKHLEVLGFIEVIAEKEKTKNK